MAQLEDRRFFAAQYIKTLPLNFASIALKFVLSAAWVVIGNASLLGYYSLASGPSAISQRAAVAGALLRTALPVINDAKSRSLIVQTAIIADMAVLAGASAVLCLFFVLSNADIVRNLGLVVFLFVSAVPAFEALPGGAVHVCNARREYGWNFVLGNLRVIVAIIGLAILMSGGSASPKIGVGIWAAGLFSSVVLALVYFKRAGLSLGRTESGWFHAEFLANLKRSTHHLLLYRCAILLYGALPTLFLAFIGNTRDAGLFAFAMTLGGFVYAGIAPVNEQVYSPTISVLVQNEEKGLLRRRLAQMTVLTAALAAAASLLLYFGGPPALRLVGKVAFLESFNFLPVLLAYFALTLVFSGYTYALLCMSRFKALIAIDTAAVAIAGAWYLVFSGTPLVYGCLPAAALAEGGLSALYILRLTGEGAPLVRRTVVPVSS